MIINKEKKQLYILLACGVLALAVSIWAFRMEKSTGMMVSAEIEDRSFTSGQDDKYTGYRGICRYRDQKG